MIYTLSNETKIRSIEYLLMFLFLAVSGGEFFCMTYGRFFIPLFFLLAFWFHTTQYHRIRVFKGANYILVGLTYMVIHYFLIYPNHVKNTFLPSVIMLFGSYLFLTTYSLSRFKKVYLNTVYVMAIISFVVLAIANLGLVSPTINYGADPPTYMLFAHNVGRTAVSPRLSGIYWEPGAYQIVLNIVFLLHIKEIIENRIAKKDRKKFIVILVAVLLTVSTAAYIFLAMLVGYWGLMKLKMNFSFSRLILTVFVGAVIGAGIFMSDAVQGKLLEREQGYDSSSYTIRMNDNLALLIMISQKPIIGWGRDSREFIQTGEKFGSIAFSNGVFSMIACLGFPFFFIYVLFLYKGVKGTLPNQKALIIVLLFLFLNCFEDFWWLPVANVFFFLNPDTQAIRIISRQPNRCIKIRNNDKPSIDRI